MKPNFKKSKIEYDFSDVSYSNFIKADHAERIRRQRLYKRIGFVAVVTFALIIIFN